MMDLLTDPWVWIWAIIMLTLIWTYIWHRG